MPFVTDFDEYYVRFVKFNVGLFQINYKKQRKEVIDSYRGFQTMDSKDHPVVQQGIKAAELASDVSANFLVYLLNCLFCDCHTIIVSIN